MKTLVLCIAIAVASMAAAPAQQPTQVVRLRVVTLGSPLLAGGQVFEIREGDVVEVNDRKFRVTKGVRIAFSSTDHVRLIRRQDGKSYDVEAAPAPARVEPGEFVGTGSTVRTGQTVPAMPDQGSFRPTGQPFNGVPAQPQMRPGGPGQVPMPMFGPGAPGGQISVDHDGNLSIGPNRDVQFNAGSGHGAPPIMIAQSGWLYIYDNGRAYKIRQSDMKLVAMTELGPEAMIPAAAPALEPPVESAKRKVTRHRTTHTHRRKKR